MTVPSPMTFAVYGAGAIGGLVAAQLAQHGADVHLVCRTEAQAEAINRSGLRLSTLTGAATVRLTALTAPTIRADTAIVAVKAYALESMLEAGAFRDARTVVPLLNGLEHPDVLRRGLPGIEVRVGAIYATASRTDIDAVEQQSAGAHIALGPAGLPGDDALKTALVAAGFAIDVHHEQRVLWEKFTRVCWAATLCSVLGSTAGVARTALHDEAHVLAAELAAVATADGVPTDADRLRETLWDLPPSLEPSMVRDVVAGGPSETEAISGALIRRARSLGIAVPVAERLYARLRQSDP